MSALHVRLFGNFSMLMDDVPISTAMVPRVQSLLIYLLLHRNVPHSRSHLAFLLWPDSTEAQAHTNLRQLLYHLRQSFPNADQFLAIEKHHLQWLPTNNTVSCTLDILEFEQALAQASQAEQIQDMPKMLSALEVAMSLYRGDLVVDCYEEWILPERDRLRQLFMQTAERMMVLQEQERNYAGAIATARHILHSDPLREETYRQLMRLYSLQDDRAAALRVYHTCVTTMERELGVEPSKFTQALYESLVKSNVPSEKSVNLPKKLRAVPPLLGRKAEWQMLQSAWRKSTEGHPHLVLLMGEAGIGKTRLAEEMETWVRRQSVPSASARCYASFGHLAYAPVTAWLRSEVLQTAISSLNPVWLAEIARLLPELLISRPELPRPSAMEESWQQQQLFEALTHAILGIHQPLLLMLDDVQWCDAETLQWLQYVFHFAQECRLLLVGTIRIGETVASQPLISFLSALQRDGLVTEIALGPLTNAETTSLAEHVVGQQLDPEKAQYLYTETEGNPLFVVEMARVDIGEGMKPSMPQQNPLLLSQTSSTLPPTVQTVITTRLAQLSSLAQEVAQVASVIGREFTFPILMQASGRGEDEVVRGLDELWQRRIVREQDTGAYDFSHDKLREQVYLSLSPTYRRLMHRRVAEAFEHVYSADLDAYSGQIAMQYELSGQSTQALTYYMRAANVARSIYANAEAMRVLRRAVALLEAGASSKASWKIAAQFYEALGDVSEEIGEYEEARQTYRRAMTDLIPPQEYLWQGRLWRKIANTWTHATPNLYDTLRVNARQAFQEAERVLKLVPDHTSQAWREEWIELQFNQIWPLNWSEKDLTAAIEKVQPLVKRYGTQEQRDFLIQAKATRSLVRNRYATPPSEEKQLFWHESLEAIQRTGNKSKLGVHHLACGIDLWCAGSLDEAEEHLRTAFHIGEQTGIVRLQSRSLMFLSFIFRQRGQVEAMHDFLKHAQAIGIAWDNSVLTSHRAWLAWREGNLAEAENQSRMALEDQPLENNPFQWVGRWPLVGVMLSQKRFAEAMAEVRILLDPTQQPPPEPLNTFLSSALRAWNAGLEDEACAFLQQAIPLAEQAGYL